MKIDIMTLFPEMINAVMRESIIGRAQDKGVVEVKATNIRDYALDKHHKADDAPYGGGRGQVMLAEPLYLCHQALSAGEHVHTVFLSAQGQPFNQQKARELLAKEHFILVCGHYEGIPGSTEPLKDGEEALEKAKSYGFPIILKAAAGGGGRGMPHGAGRSAGRGSVHGGKPLGRSARASAVHPSGKLARQGSTGGASLRPPCKHRSMETRNEPAPHEKGSA